VRTLHIDEDAATRQRWRVADVRQRRDAARAERALARLVEVAEGSANTMPPLLECARAYVTIGEMCGALRQVWGEYEEVPAI
jgi:methylmalonyl-CoA mutase N-terminal domain/subunit